MMFKQPCMQIDQGVQKTSAWWLCCCEAHDSLYLTFQRGDMYIAHGGTFQTAEWQNPTL